MNKHFVKAKLNSLQHSVFGEIKNNMNETNKKRKKNKIKLK